MNINVRVENYEESHSVDKKKMIKNIIFGQKLVYLLSEQKKKEANINYFIMHINSLQLIHQEMVGMDIDYEQYVDKISDTIFSQNKNKKTFTIGNKQIEPYCKKPIQYIPQNIFITEYNFHYSITNIKSKYYDLLYFIFDKYKNIVGYVVLGKKVKKLCKNLYFVIDKNYDKTFYKKTTKKINLLSEICDEFSIYEKTVYQEYLKYWRDYLITILIDCLKNIDNIKNLIFIGNNKGGNLLELFIKDIFENINNEQMKEMSWNIFKMNTAMLTNLNFFKDILENHLKEKYTIINCYTNKELSYKTWDEFIKYYKNDENINTIVLKKESKNSLNDFD
jgi:hypothetical protein